MKHILSDIQLVSNSGKGRQIVLLEKIKELTSSKKVIYILMTLLVFLWGLEFIAAKAALDAIKPLSLVCFKYLTGLIFDYYQGYCRQALPVKTQRYPASSDLCLVRRGVVLCR